MKQACGYCRGITYDDSRGNCVACGAPREDAPATQPVYIPSVWTPYTYKYSDYGTITVSGGAGDTEDYWIVYSTTTADTVGSIAFSNA